MPVICECTLKLTWWRFGFLLGPEVSLSAASQPLFIMDLWFNRQFLRHEIKTMGVVAMYLQEHMCTYVLLITCAWSIRAGISWTFCQTDTRNDQTCDLLTRKKCWWLTVIIWTGYVVSEATTHFYGLLCQQEGANIHHPILLWSDTTWITLPLRLRVHVHDRSQTCPCNISYKKATRFLQQPIATEGIWLVLGITLTSLLYTVEWQ